MSDIVRDLLNDRYDHIMLNTPKSERPDEVNDTIDMLTEELVRWVWVYGDRKEQIIARLLRTLPSQN